MNPERLFFVSKQVALFALAFGIIVLPGAIPGVAQERAMASKPKPEPASRAHSDSAAADNDYSKKIKEYTTEPYFMTV